jgi:hypothetical protein
LDCFHQTLRGAGDYVVGEMDGCIIDYVEIMCVW